MREELKAHLAAARRGSRRRVFAVGHRLPASRAVSGPRAARRAADDDRGRLPTRPAAARPIPRAAAISARVTASGMPVRKDDAGRRALPATASRCRCSTHVGHPPRADADAAVLDAVETAIARGARVLLQIMDPRSSAGARRAQACLDEIARRWPRQGPGRRRCLPDAAWPPPAALPISIAATWCWSPARSFSAGPPSAARCWCLRRSRTRSTRRGDRAGLLGLCQPQRLAEGAGPALRSRFASRPNFGQWLRWEAALEEIGAYYRVPDAFRAKALREFRAGIESLIAAVAVASAWSQPRRTPAPTMRSCAQPTIFPFTLQRGGRRACPPMIAACCIARWRGSSAAAICGSAADRDDRGAPLPDRPAGRARARGASRPRRLRLCVGARLVTEAWSPDAARRAAQSAARARSRRRRSIAKIELLLALGG